MKPQLRVVDSEQPHNLDLARQRIAQFKLDRERGEKPLPVATAHDVHGAPLLDAIAVEVNARPNHAPSVGERKRRSLFARLCWWR